MITAATVRGFREELEKDSGAWGDALAKITRGTAMKGKGVAKFTGKHVRPGGMLPNLAPKVDPFMAMRGKVPKGMKPSGLHLAV